MTWEKEGKKDDSMENPLDFGKTDAQTKQNIWNKKNRKEDILEERKIILIENE